MSSQERLPARSVLAGLTYTMAAWPVEATADGTRHSADNSRR